MKTRILLALVGTMWAAHSTAAPAAGNISEVRTAHDLGFRLVRGFRRVKSTEDLGVLPVHFETRDLTPWTRTNHPTPAEPQLETSDGALLQERLDAVALEKFGTWGFEATPIEEGAFPARHARIEDPHQLAEWNKARSLHRTVALTVMFQRCETPEGLVVCVRGEDTAWGTGEPGFAAVFGVGWRPQNNRRSPRPKKVQAVVKHWTYRSSADGAEFDAPILPRVDGSYADKAADVFSQVLDYAWIAAHRREAKRREH